MDFQNSALTKLLEKVEENDSEEYIRDYRE